jgi:hypothetical protein
MKTNGIFILVFCLIVIAALALASQFVPHGSTPRDGFRYGVMNVGNKLGFEAVDETTTSFDPADPPFLERLEWRMSHRQNEQKIQVVLESQNPMQEFGFRNKMGAYILVDAYESSNQVFLVTLHAKNNAETLNDWSSSLYKVYPQLRIVKQ